MSVNQHQLYMYGISISYDEYKRIEKDEARYDDLDCFYNEDKEVGCVVDGMNGEYCLVGKILLMVKGYAEDVWLGNDGPITLPTLKPAERKRIAAEIEKIVGYPVKPTYLLVNHWT